MVNQLKLEWGNKGERIKLTLVIAWLGFVVTSCLTLVLTSPFLVSYLFNLYLGHHLILH
ncbi:MAG: hypothetical protein BroJett011_59380 [Chloroflexota bacterium]|nr:MAG: hypothetical protein BroJett011_59380 [Chloroflexota bacterium]